MKKIIQGVIKYLTLFVAGAIIYMTIEILFRGYTYMQMGVVGGIVMIVIGLLDEPFKKELPVIIYASMSAIIITLIEYIAGYIFNIKLGMNMWDYSDLPFNVDGQVCLYFSLAWGFLGIVASVIDNLIRHYWFGEPKSYLKWI